METPETLNIFVCDTFSVAAGPKLVPTEELSIPPYFNPSRAVTRNPILGVLRLLARPPTGLFNFSDRMLKAALI